jgi:hypothetical protein
MGVITIPTDVHIGPRVPCVVCQHHVPLSEATIGAMYADGRPAFACEVHRLDRDRWLLAWLRFERAQRRTSNKLNSSVALDWSLW